MHTFPRARQGYDRAAVDAFLDRIENDLATAQQENASLRAERQQLGESLAALETAYDRLRTAGVDARAQDILDGAEARAADIVAGGERAAENILWQARRHTEVLDERSRQEHAWRRRQLRQERAELTRQQQALRDQLASFRSLAVDTAQRFPDLAELSFADVASSVSAAVPSEQHV